MEDHSPFLVSICQKYLKLQIHQRCMANRPCLLLHMHLHATKFQKELQAHHPQATVLGATT